MLRVIRGLKFTSLANRSTNSTLPKVFLAPFTLFTLGDCECIGRILGAAICYCEGFSCDDFETDVEVGSSNDGSIYAKSQLTWVPHESTSGSSSQRELPIHRVTIERVVKQKTEMPSFPPLFHLDVLASNAVMEDQLSNAPISSPEMAEQLIRIFRETGISVSRQAFNSFLTRLREYDESLSKKYEREFEFEMNLTQQIFHSEPKVRLQKNLNSGKRNEGTGKVSKLERLRSRK